MRKASPYCVAEIGGLATEVLYLVKREIRFVQTYNTGSLRIRQQLQNSGIPDKRMTEVAEGQAKEMALSLVQNIRDLESLKLVLLGREMRFAASRILPDWNGEGLCTVPVSDLAKLVSGIVAQPLDELARIHQFAYPDAETLGPALMIALRMAKAMSLKTVSVGGMSFCDGLVIEAVDELAWNKRMSRHILRIAQESGLKYRHDARGHHKHSMYIIQHMEFPGLSSHIINLIAFVARYHRKAVPLPIHQDYMALPHDDRLAVCKLAALLRVADALDRVHDQSLGDIRFDLQEGLLTCIPAQPIDISAEQLALAEKGDLFEQIYGRRRLIRNL